MSTRGVRTSDNISISDGECIPRPSRRNIYKAQLETACVKKCKDDNIYLCSRQTKLLRTVNPSKPDAPSLANRFPSGISGALAHLEIIVVVTLELFNVYIPKLFIKVGFLYSDI